MKAHDSELPRQRWFVMLRYPEASAFLVMEPRSFASTLRMTAFRLHHVDSESCALICLAVLAYSVPLHAAIGIR